MQDFDTTTDDSDAAGADDERECKRQRLRDFWKLIAKRFVLFVSFGPGVLGFLWLLGRILKR